MTDVMMSELQRVLTFLPRNRFAFLLKKMSPVALQPLPAKTVLVLSLYDWFAHLGNYVSDDQQQRIVGHFSLQLERFTAAAWENRQAVLTLSEGRFAAVTGSTAWYDYELDGTCHAMPEAAVTHISCDLTALGLRVYKKVLELRGGRDAAAERRDGPTGRPA